MLRTFARLSIQWKLPLLVAGVMLVVTWALLYTSYREVRRSASRAAEQRLLEVMTQLVGSLQANTQGLEVEARKAAVLPATLKYFHARAPESRTRLLEEIATAGGADTTAAALDLRDTTGRVLGLVGRQAVSVRGLRLPDLERVRASPERVAVGSMQTVGDTIFYPTAAAVTEQGKLLGYLVRWRRLLPRPRERSQIATLFGGGSTLLIGSRGGAWTDQVSAVATPAVELVPSPRTVRYRSATGEQFLAAVGQDPHSEWLVVLQQPDSTVTGPAVRFLTNVGAVALGICVLGLLLVWSLSHRITVPLRRLTTAAEVMGTGEYPAEITPESEDEVGRLAQTFNQMARQVASEASARNASETQWRMLFRQNPHPMWVFQPGTLRFLAVNDAAIAKYGYSREEFLTMTLRDIRPAEDVPALLAHFDDATHEDLLTGVFRHRTRDGRMLDVEVVANAVEFDGQPARLTMAQDMSARRALESQLRQAQKMEAVGRLAGGVAHDFNNLLAVIMTYTELVRLDLADDDPHAADLDEVRGAAERAHTLTKQLLTFSRQRVLQPSVLDPNAVVASIDRMLRRLIGEDIDVVTRLSPEAGRIRVDPGQFEQILMNLAVNSRDAMPDGGTLTIRTEGVTVDEASLQFYGLPESGQYVVVSVSDTGIGMTEETRLRVFEPFFTTKEVGKGTGLGLATVYAIVSQCGGSVSLYSEPGLGTTFRLYFPAEIGAASPGDSATQVAELVGGSETILLVEDEAAVRAAASEVLRRLGYIVLAAQSAEDAIATLTGHHSRVDLVISDVVMPRKDGPTLVAELRRLRPGLKALLMSGYTGDAIASRGVRESGIRLLEKPFTVDLLGRTVREVLDTG